MRRSSYKHWIELEQDSSRNSSVREAMFTALPQLSKLSACECMMQGYNWRRFAGSNAVHFTTLTIEAMDTSVGCASLL